MGAVTASIRSTVTTFTVLMRFDPPARERALELLQAAGGPIRAKRGCRSCRVEGDGGGPERVRYTEEWESEEDFGRHVRSDAFLWVLAAMDLCSAEPEVAVEERSELGGLEVLRRYREGE